MGQCRALRGILVSTAPRLGQNCHHWDAATTTTTPPTNTFQDSSLPSQALCGGPEAALIADHGGGQDDPGASFLVRPEPTAIKHTGTSSRDLMCLLVSLTSILNVVRLSPLVKDDDSPVSREIPGQPN
eukprot:CAMPEP_0184689816 /NCGR_PEP_ID=MMETSP0312-20130426/30868_1 /TAXON_ID=31354 /ORGANISM="Compsopogon coeruleus, Strain SAG 36.94" /LENGTH=127 /DNA_ID=CAMNT_0027147211 /DNA_START=982 /DNA_END=1362 /DNA_ORIENTATION=-